MLDKEAARAAAQKSSVLRAGVRLGDATELPDGWYFPCLADGPAVGCNGVIVNKQTGKLFHLGSAFPVERDLAMYGRGYQFESYDLAVVDIRDLRKTIHTLTRLRLDVVEPRVEHGVVWRVPRRMTHDELVAKLEHLPAVFSAIRLYFELEHLEQARTAGWFTFEVREHADA